MAATARLLACIAILATLRCTGAGTPDDVKDPDPHPLLDAFTTQQSQLLQTVVYNVQYIVEQLLGESLEANFSSIVSQGTTPAANNNCAFGGSTPLAQGVTSFWGEYLFRTWGSMVIGLVSGITEGGVQTGAAMVNAEMVNSWTSSQKSITIPDANAGSGFGMGIVVMCGYTQLFSFGGGGGGGTGVNSSGFGGGGNANSDVLNDGAKITVGGGGGCSCADNTCFSCGSQANVGSASSTLTDIVNELKPSFASCTEPMSLCLSVSAGAGISIPSADCQFGANFGVNAALALNAWAGGREQDPNTYCSYNPGQDDNAQNVYTQISNTCNTQCGYTQYNVCWCPCYKSLTLAAGFTWATTLNCAGN